MLDGGLAPAITVGRTLSAYTVGAVQNHQIAITYTVYNEQAEAVTGVLLTDTLEAGASFKDASAPASRDGQKFAVALGTIAGYDRASVTVDVALDDPLLLRIDEGAAAFATLDAGMVSDSTAAVVLRPGDVDPALLASTPDANTTDPFIQEEAAKLDYDPQRIIDWLHSDIGYNSYLGSVRGARGTLWSQAGNALDVASLGVALLRASGVPAQYVQGTLSETQAQGLILSMFPASYQTVGYIPASTATADPANDQQLLAETESHYWLRFDTGAGMQDADPLLGGYGSGTFTAAQGTFAEVPDALREKTRVTLDAEIYSVADAAFGGTGLKTTTVLDQTFNDVDLVGKPITLGHFVSSDGGGFGGLSTVVNTYSPYLQVGDNAYDANTDKIIRGTDYQEVLTNFPLGSQYLTGLFLNFTLSGPDGPSETYSKTLVDRIGFASRHTTGIFQIAPVDPDGAPVITPFDSYTVSVLPGGRPLATAESPGIVGNAAADMKAFVAEFGSASSHGRDALAQQAFNAVS